MNTDKKLAATPEVFAARFPIFGTEKDVFGYELSFRSGFDAYCQAAEDEQSDVDLTAFVKFRELSGGKKGLLDFSREQLLVQLPRLFSRDSLVVSVPSRLAGDAEVITCCQDLKHRGYSLAISNFSVDHLNTPLWRLADLVKVDVSTVSEADQQRILECCSQAGVTAMARNLDTLDQFEHAQTLGYGLFHGSFFARPDIRKDRQIGSNQVICLQMLREVNAPTLNYDRIAQYIEQDVFMTYTLLKLINSTWFGLRYAVKSVRHALVLLGPPEIRRWSSLVAMNKAAQDKPDELLKLSLTRAKFAETLALTTGKKEHASELFLLGMFSVLDALLDQPMADLLEEVAVSDNIKSALLTGGGIHSRIYQLLLAYEYGQWVLFGDLARALKIDETLVPDLHRKALAWAQQALQS